MLREFKLQDPGEGIHEVEIQEISCSSGDEVEEGDILFVVESDKAAIELTSPHDGTIKDIKVEEGQVAKVGDVLVTIDATGEDAENGDDEATSSEEDTDKSEDEKAGAKEDARDDRSEDEDEKSKQAGSKGKSSKRRDDGPVKAAPAARKLAKEKGIDIADVPASGSHGHVTKEDVQTFAEDGGTAGRRQTRHEPVELPDFTKFGEVEIEPLRSIRKATARQMQKSWSEIPHVLHEERIDITGLEQFRRKYAAGIEEQGGRLTVTAFIIKAAALALKKHPRFNASLDMGKEEIIYKKFINIGMAVDSEKGLLVPVIRGVDRLNVFDLARQIPSLAERVRKGKPGPKDLSGGTFTITNIGALGGTGFFPIINHPEVAILGVGRSKLEPVIDGDLDDYSVDARLIMPVSLCFDHRVNDGADAARFMNDFADILMNFERLAIYADGISGEERNDD